VRRTCKIILGLNENGYSGLEKAGEIGNIKAFEVLEKYNQ